MQEDVFMAAGRHSFSFRTKLYNTVYSLILLLLALPVVQVQICATRAQNSTKSSSGCVRLRLAFAKKWRKGGYAFRNSFDCSVGRGVCSAAVLTGQYNKPEAASL